MAAGGVHTMAIKEDGTLWAWGVNIYGELGDGSTTDKLTPEQIMSVVDKTALTAVINNATTLLGSKSIGTAVGNVSQAAHDV